MNWKKALETMKKLADRPDTWKYGQNNSVKWVADRLSKQTAVLIADEVGMG